MEEKSSREQYRVRTYGGPTGRATQSSVLPSASDPTGDPGLPISTSRAIIQFDADAFYAQVEEGRNPRLKGVPLAVTQKYLIVTCNQAARRLGVTKLQGVTEAKQQVPSLVLVNGEDLTPYRQASKRIFSVLARFGTAERLGMDEVFVDVTAEVQARIQRGFLCSTYNGHIHTAEMALKQETKHRPMDLRAARSAFGELASGAVPYESAGVHAPWEASLKIASHIAAEARAAVKAETGFRTSAGISCSKMLAKLVSGMHKPDDQTVMLPCHAAAFVATLPVRAIPGIGWKMDQELTALGVTSANDLRSVPLANLTKVFGERTAKYMYSACRGEDTTPVIQSGAPKSITVEDSFKSCTTFPAALHVLQILAPDLIARLDEDFEEHNRRAGTMTLKWRQKKQGWSRSSTSIFMPVQWQASKEQQVEAMVQASLSILRKNLAQPFSLTLLNIGATNFSAPLNMERGVPKAFKNFFGAQASAGTEVVSQQAAGEELRQTAQVAITARKDYGAVPKGQPLTKSHERALSEAAATRAAAASLANSASLSDEDALPEEDDWGIESAPGPELPFSMPNGRAVHTDSRLAHGSSIAGKPRLGEQLKSKDMKLQSGPSPLEHGMAKAVISSHKPLAAQTDGQRVQQDLELSDNMHLSSTDEMLGIELPAQYIDHSRSDASELAGEKQIRQTNQPNGGDTMQHSSRLTELQKLQALSDASKQQAPQWVGSSPADLSADLRLAQKLQQEELRWHQLHSRADTAKRKLKKESTLDAFFKKPAR
ncbi:g2519 [Coccomyxa viridis]|uniref:G2519 protein n=1 Tax=Coccomyxa viridis TaxID=1274662 RepID=A0ABP1FR15_9CHLO